MSRALKMLLAASAVCLWVGVAPPATAQQKITSGKAESQQIERGRYVIKIAAATTVIPRTMGWLAEGFRSRSG
jgi:hypothetical protein